MHPHDRLGDDAKDPLGADQQPIDVGPAGASGDGPRFDRSARRDDAQADHHVLDPAVGVRERAGRACCQPSPQRGKGKRVGLVAESQSVWGKGGFQVGAEDACLEPGRERLPVNCQQPVHPRQIEGHRHPVVSPLGLDASGDVRPPTERDQADPVLHGQLDEGRHLLVRRGIEDQVRDALEEPGAKRIRSRRLRP